MDPVSQSPPSQYGPEYDHEPPVVPPAPPVVKQARVGLIALIVLVTQIVVIAAADNQWVADRIAKRVVQTDNVTEARLGGSWLTYAWRFSPLSGDHYHVWLSNLLLVLVTIAGSTLLVFALVRGPVTFFRAFFGVWLSVVAATQLGAFVRGLVNTTPVDRLQGGRAIRALFGPSGPTGLTVWASAALGLVVGLITAIVAVSTRRKTGGAEPLPAAVLPPTFPDYVAPSTERGSAPPPWQDRYAGPPTPTDATVSFGRPEPTTPLPDPEGLAGYGRPPLGEPAPSGPPAGEAFTTELPRVPAHAAAEETSQLPAVEAAPVESAPVESPAGAHQTTRLPYVPEPGSGSGPEAAPEPEPEAGPVPHAAPAWAGPRSAPEPVPALATQPGAAAEPVAQPAPVAEPLPAQPVEPARAPQQVPVPEPAPEPSPAPEPAPEPVPEPAPEPEPVPAPEPAPPAPEPPPAPSAPEPPTASPAQEPAGPPRTEFRSPPPPAPAAPVPAPAPPAAATVPPIPPPGPSNDFPRPPDDEDLDDLDTRAPS